MRRHIWARLHSLSLWGTDTMPAVVGVGLAPSSMPKTMLAPSANAAEAAVVVDTEVISVSSSLIEAVAFFSGRIAIAPLLFQD